MVDSTANSLVLDNPGAGIITAIGRFLVDFGIFKSSMPVSDPSLQGGCANIMVKVFSLNDSLAIDDVGEAESELTTDDIRVLDMISNDFSQFEVAISRHVIGETPKISIFSLHLAGSSLQVERHLVVDLSVGA